MSVTFVREVVINNIAQGKLTLIVWDNADLVNKEPAGNVIVNETITASFSMGYKYLDLTHLLEQQQTTTY